MAKQVLVQVLDDIDGTEADESINFSIDGVEYEIDLSTKNARKLHKAFEPWVTAARKVGRVSRRGKSRTSEVGKDENATIRAWAQEHGHKVSARGRIPADVVHAYRQANK